MATPLLQQVFRFTNDGKLDGYIESAPNVDLTLEGWWNGTYQERKTNYFNDSLGLRTWLVRLNNQIDFSLFKKVNVREVVIGKNNNLFEHSYIEEYCGKEKNDLELIEERLIKLKRIQDTLAGMGISFVYIFPPSKAYYYPEDFPESNTCLKPDSSTYKLYIPLIKKLGINHIDFNSWFCAMKDTASSLLIAKQGIHWTTYGAWLAGDSLSRYIERIRNIQMVHVQAGILERTTVPRNNDNDLALAMNLLLSMEGLDTFSYPGELSLLEHSTTTKPNAIYIGDSFMWAYRYLWLMEFVNSYYEIWYYMNEVWTKSVFDGDIPVIKFNEHDYEKALKETDVVILQLSEPNLNYNTGRFVDSMYQLFFVE